MVEFADMRKLHLPPRSSNVLPPPDKNNLNTPQPLIPKKCLIRNKQNLEKGPTVLIKANTPGSRSNSWD